MAYQNVPWMYSGSEVEFVRQDLITVDEIVNIIVRSVKAKTPLSLIRIGDGELSVMAQNIVLPVDYLKKSAAWNSTDYCGVCLKQDMNNNYEIRDKCIDAVKNADLVGVFPNGEFTNKVFSAIHFKPAKVFYAFGNLIFCAKKSFVDLIISNPPLLIGKLAGDFAEYIEKVLGVRAAGYYTDIRCPEDIDRTLEYMANTPHDWSLVSAGVNADIIAPMAAKKYGKVCIDYGQGMSVLLNPKYKGRYKFHGHEWRPWQ